MIQKLIVAALVCASTNSLLMAKEHHAKAGEFYIVTKALMTTSESIKEGEHITLDADVGGGVGIDFGYTLPYHFAVELDTSYSKNRVTESEAGVEEKEDGIATYWTYAFDVTYTYPVTDLIGLMGKVGYEFEHESIADLDINADDSGVVYGAGVEYHISEHYEALVEYEASTIESPRGSSVYAGLKYIF